MIFLFCDIFVILFLKAVQGLFEKIEKEAIEQETFIEEQNEMARKMKDEMNHLIEYFTVLKKSAEMIFGEEV